MNMQFRGSPEQASSVHAKTAIADCDIHPARATYGLSLHRLRQAARGPINISAFQGVRCWRNCGCVLFVPVAN